MSNFSEHKAAQARCFHPTGKFVEFSKDDVEQSIPKLFESRINRYLNCIAIKTVDREMTYDELNRKANVIARVLLDQFSEGENSIALMFGRSGRHILVCMSELMEYKKLPDVRLITIGSDVVHKKDIENCRKILPPDCIIVINFVTTETGTVRQYFTDMDTEIITNVMPVGYEIEGQKILILNDDQQEVGVDCIGEIAVKSQYLSPGYWRLPDLTDAKFLPDPNGGDERTYLTGDLGRISSDGILMHLGRKDFQVKIRGYRVEIGEVENSLLDIEGVKDALVVAKEYDTDDKRLVAYIVQTGKVDLNVSMLRRALLEKLPDYMIPSAFVMLDSIPRNPNGKPDRLSLPEPENVRPELETPFVPPQTPIEEKLAEIWKEVLGIDRVGIHDNFLELGGHSLLASRIISRAMDSFQLKIPLQILFKSPTIKDMSVAIIENQMGKEKQEIMDKILSEMERLTVDEIQQLLDKKQGE